jgi:outer membrane protein assembly factor BamB
MKFTLTQRKQTASFRIAGLMLAIAPLWLMVAAANTSAHAQTTSSSADWTQFLRDNMQRWNPYETVLSVNSLETRGLKLNWQSPTGNFYLSLSSPVVANGAVYYGSFDYSVDALTGHVYALNASTGAQLWTFATGGPVVSSPAVANGVVYIAADGNLYALNASTGAKMWSYAAANIGGSPTVVNGVVYISCEPGPLLALNASTGALLWSYSPESSGSGAWSGLYRLRGQRRPRVCAERQHRRPAVELCHRIP